MNVCLDNLVDFFVLEGKRFIELVTHFHIAESDGELNLNN